MFIITGSFDDNLCETVDNVINSIERCFKTDDTVVKKK